MYDITTVIEGTTPILQHRFSPATLNTLMQGTTKKTGAADYSTEWMDTMYVTPEGTLYQPATHIEGAMVKAAASFRIKGARGKTWKDPIRAYCYVTPEQVLHLHHGKPVPAPDASLLEAPTEHLSVSVMRVKVQRAAVARARLQIAAGWQLAFTIEVLDEQVRPEVVREVLTEAGRAVGIGDYRPRYGRFVITSFEVRHGQVPPAVT